MTKEKTALSKRGKQLLAHIVTSVAFQAHGEGCDLESVATAFKLTLRGLRQTVRKMEAAGVVTVEGSAEWSDEIATSTRYGTPVVLAIVAASVVTVQCVGELLRWSSRTMNRNERNADRSA